MPGAYDGPYPQTDDVRQALRSASALSWANLEHDDLTIGETAFRLRRGVGAGLAAILRPTSSRPPSVALWQHRVLVLQFPSPAAEFEEDAPFVVVVDGTTGKVIAYEGHVPLSARKLPKPWT
jgi:hypothetical protein